MKAMIFAAGLGTRLKPVTDHIPKALVQIGGKPLLQHVIEKLIRSGCSEVVVNVHHFPDQIREFLESHRNFGITIHISDESDILLDTGGGLMKAAGFLRGEEPVLMHNVDVVSDLDLKLLVGCHRERKALATLVVRNRETSRYLLFDDLLRLAGWMNRSTGEVRYPVLPEEGNPVTGPERNSVSRPGNLPVPGPDPHFVSRVQGNNVSLGEGTATPAEDGNDITLAQGNATSCLPMNAIPLAFSGIQVVEPALFSLIRKQGKFPIIDAYLELAAEHLIMGFVDNFSFWMDIGKPGQLKEADRLMKEAKATTSGGG